jgi:hypothetical protein
MPDITMCNVSGCSKEQTCRRHIEHYVRLSPFQWFFADDPRDPETRTCVQYWPFDTRDEED